MSPMKIPALSVAATLLVAMLGPRADAQIPASMRVEHHEIHDALVALTRAPGPVGAAARELAAVLDPHFVREEQIALPPLGLLASLAARNDLTPAMHGILPITDSLRAELPRMLEEHKTIHAATVTLGEAGKAANNAAAIRFAETLALHAQNEEEILYPAAILVGEVVRRRAGQN